MHWGVDVTIVVHKYLIRLIQQIESRENLLGNRAQAIGSFIHVRDLKISFLAFVFFIPSIFLLWPQACEQKSNK